MTNLYDVEVKTGVLSLLSVTWTETVAVVEAVASEAVTSKVKVETVSLSRSLATEIWPEVWSSWKWL